MASWYALNKHKSAREIEKQAKMEDYFGVAWCHVSIFGSGENTVNFLMIWCNGPCLRHRVLLYRRRVPLSLSYFADAFWAEEIYMRATYLPWGTHQFGWVNWKQYVSAIEAEFRLLPEVAKEGLSSRIYLQILPSSHLHHPQFIVTTKVHISLVGAMVSLGYFEYRMGLGFRVHYCKCDALMVILKILKLEVSS